ncbi:hypothetical protein MMC30_001722 [Trapelia coarctata]|nr:hypothetical protein [Trapelia coarctata]
MQRQDAGAEIPVVSTLFTALFMPVANNKQLPGWYNSIGRSAMRWAGISFGVCAAMVVIPYLFFLLFRWYSFRWWRKRMHRETSHNKRDSGFTKTWYGWAEKRKSTHHGQRWKDMSDIIWYALHWRSRTENYEWWFWDPDGSKARAHTDRRDRSVLRYLPEWMRPYRPASSQDDSETSHVHAGDIESGQSSPILYDDFGNHASRVSMDGQMDLRNSSAGQAESENWQGSHRIPSAVMSGALTDLRNASTVRRRHISKGKPPIWNPGSKEMEQLFEDEKNHQLGLPVVDDDLTSQGYNKCPPANHESDPSTAGRRTQSMPIIADVMTHQTKLKHRFRNIHSAEQLLRANEHHDCGSGDFETPHKSDFKVPMVSSTSAHDAEDTSLQSYPNTSGLKCNEDTPTSLGSKVKWWTHLQDNSYGRPFGSDDHNVAGLSRDFSFVTAQQRQSSNLQFDHLSAYEVERSLDQAISDHGSSTSTRADMLRLSQYRKRWYQRPSLISSTKRISGVYPKGLASTGEYDSVHSLPRTARTSAAPHSFRTPRKRRWPIDRGIYVSMVVEPTDDEQTHRSAISRSATFQRVSGTRSALFPPSHDHFESWRSGFKSKNSVYSRLNEEEEHTPLQQQTRYSAQHGLSNREGQILPSRQSACGEAEPALDGYFAQSLHGKLERLQYELSPGFRGPPSAFGAAWGRWAPVFSANIQTRVKSLGDSKLLKENVRRSATSPLRTAQSAAIKPPQPLSEKRGINNSTTTTNSSKSKPPSVQQRHSTQQEEHGFDPAAWMLRRPPRGTESEFGPPNVLYAGKFGVRRTLAEWNPTAASKNRKRGSSEAELPDPPAKTIRRVSDLVKVRLKRGENGWLPLGFVKRESEKG